MATKTILRRSHRTSLLNEGKLEYDRGERGVLVISLETAVKHFLENETVRFKGWYISETVTDANAAFFYLEASSGVNQEISLDHFAEVKRNLPLFVLKLPVSNVLDTATKSSRAVRKCYLEYDISLGSKVFSRSRIKKIVLRILLVILLFALLVLGALFFKHTEHDSSRLAPLWRGFSPDL